MYHWGEGVSRVDDVLDVSDWDVVAWWRLWGKCSCSGVLPSLRALSSSDEESKLKEIDKIVSIFN